jgi:MYXO-CTERM domain-containing protein
MCRRLADQMIECCATSCQVGPRVEPICTREGALEQCPVGAQQCAAGSCSGGEMPMPGGGGGCSCASALGAKDGALFFLALAALIVFRRRRSGV